MQKAMEMREIALSWPEAINVGFGTKNGLAFHRYGATDGKKYITIQSESDVETFNPRIYHLLNCSS